MRNKRADQQYVQTMLVKGLVSLKLYHRQKAERQFAKDEADGHYNWVLVKRTLETLRLYTSNRRQRKL